MTHASTSHVGETQLDRGGRSAWGAIFAGVLVGISVFAVLSLLGMGLGLTAIEVDENNPMGIVPSASPFWLFLSQIVSLALGGFVAGRLAGVLHGIGSMLHGATVWAVSTIASLVLAVGVGVGLFNMAGAALNVIGTSTSQAVSGVTNAASAILPDDINLPDLAISQIGLEDLPDPVAARLREAGITPDNFQEETREAFRAVISRAEQAKARRAVSDTAMSILRNPTDLPAEMQSLADELIGGESAVLSEEDRLEATRVLERRLGLTPDEISAYIDQVEAQLEEARSDLQAAIDEAQVRFEEAQATAIELADAAVDRTATAALLAALAALLGLAAAMGGAYLGRPINID